MKAQRAATSGQRGAEKAEWLRQVGLIATARMMALDAVKLTMDRGDKISLYTHAQPRAPGGCDAGALVDP
jgi:hypothetical protein